MEALYDLHQEIGNLKDLRRSGWVQNGIEHCESVAAHQWRVALLAISLGPQCIDRISGRPVNVDKTIRMGICHDIAEARAGDITPRDGIPKSEKYKRELEALEAFKLLSPAFGSEILELWEEFETASTPEARLCKDLDLLDMLMTAERYQKAHFECDLSSFFSKRECYFPACQEMVDTAWLRFEKLRIEQN